MGETYRSETSTEGRPDGAAFDHTPAPGEGKPEAKEAEERRNSLEQGDLIAGKFTSQEELVKAYNALSTKLGSKEPDPEPKPEVKPPEESDGFIKKVEDKGIDFDALNTEFAESGELSADTMASLTKRGIPQEMVEAYIQGQEALVAGAVGALSEIAGSKDALALTLEWATENLSEAEIDTYNEAMKSGNVAMTTTLLRGIVAAYRADVGDDPSNIKGPGGIPTGTSPFKSNDEMNTAMADPRYRTDPTYRDGVVARISAGM